MQRIPVESSNVASIGYDEQSNVLQVEFKSGQVYDYLSVSKTCHDDLMASPSKGQFLNKHVKPNFEFRKAA